MARHALPVAAGGLLVVIAVACTSTREDTSRGEVSESREHVSQSMPKTLADLVQRTARGFERDGDAWVSRGDTSAVRVTREGAVGFSPSPARTGATLELSTRAPRLGVRSDESGAVLIEHGEMTEVLRRDGEQIEQAWRFAARPAAPPVVRLSVRGMSYAGETPSGHHFIDDASRVGVRYGRAKWIDGAGVETAVDATREGDELVLRVPAAAANGPYPAVLDPTLSPELGIDTPIPTPAGTAAASVVVQGPAGTFLAAWVDSGDAALHAVRVDANGKPTGAAKTLAYGARSVACAWDVVGSRWIVLTSTETDIRFARVAGDGTVLDAAPKVIPRRADGVDVAFDGSAFTIGWNNHDYGAATGTVDTVRVNSAAGTFDVATAVRVATTTANQLSARVRVACGDAATGCALLWTEGTVLRLSRVTSQGVLVDATSLQIATAAYDVGGLASDGTQWLATWAEQAAPPKMKTTRISAAGVVSPAVDLDARASMAAGGLAWDGTTFYATWRTNVSSSYTVWAKRIGTDGVPIEASPVSLYAGTFVGQHSLAASGTTRLLAYVANSVGGRLYGRPYSNVLAALDVAAPLVDGSNTQSQPKAALGGTGYLVAWVDTRQLAPGPGVYAARLSPAGAPLDAVATRITAAAVGDRDLAVASDGSDFLIVWESASQIFATRVGKGATTALDTPALVVGADAVPYSAPTVAYDGANYVVAWASNKNLYLTSIDIVGARITPQGARLDAAPFFISAANGTQWDPSIASDGNISFVAWSDNRTDYYASDLYGSRVSRAGASLDPQGIAIAKRAQDQSNPSVSAHAGEFTVVWLDNARTASSAYDVYANRVNAAGVVLEATSTLVAELSTYNAYPTVLDMRDGTKLVAWTGAEPDGRPRIAGAWLRGGPKLELLDPKPVVLAADPGSSTDPFLTAAVPGSAALFYARREPDGSPRARFRIVSSGSNAGTTCAATTDCASRYCKDGVCCSEACDGICKKCGASGGCDTVASADDPDTCSGEDTCDAAGACRKKNGSVCALATDCASGFCVDSFCCNAPCDGACDTCSEVRGTCTPLARGSLGTPSCSPNRCDGKVGTCATTCLSDEECADGFGCDRPTKTCIAGAVCSDLQTTRETNGSKQSCAPYACRSGRCAESCTTVTDCAYPAACDESGRCVAPPSLTGGGCAIAEGRMATSRTAPLGIALGALALGLARRRRR